MAAEYYYRAVTQVLLDNMKHQQSYNGVISVSYLHRRPILLGGLDNQTCIGNIINIYPILHVFLSILRNLDCRISCTPLEDN